MIETFLWSNLNHFARNYEEVEVRFQQDTATAHTLLSSFTAIKYFINTNFCLAPKVAWFMIYNYLSLWFIFLWGHLKSFKCTITTIHHCNLPDWGCHLIQMRPGAMDNFRKRLNQCVNNGGSHLMDIMFKPK